MTISVPGGLAGWLAGAANSGMDVCYMVAIAWGGSVGDRYYSTRDRGAPWETKLLGVPQVGKRTDVNALRFDALNDDITIRLTNAPEGLDGHYDSQVGTAGGRIQDLMTAAPLIGALVTVAVADMRSPDVLKYDSVYRVDRVDRNNAEVVLYCVDRLLHPGEKLIGSTINSGDWPVAPEDSFSQVRGPVFGKVDGLPLVPAEVGLVATLAGEIDEQDGIIFLSAGDVSLWPASGFVEIGDEVVFYQVIDRVGKVLGTAASKCVRGAGFPFTVAAAHGDNALARELTTGREAALYGGISSVAGSIALRAPESLPGSGYVLIDGECIAYSSKSGSTLSGLLRGLPVPTVAKVHNLGDAVRTFPVGPNGLPRYRYVVAEGAVAAVNNLRVRDDAGNDLPYAGGAAALSQVTGPTGKVWSVVDLPARARFERFDESGLQVPQEWITATDGRMDAEGVALAGSYLRWRTANGMSAAHMTTWPRAVDPNASTRAVIMEATVGSNVFALQFDADWDTALNDPRRKYGRFRDARLRIRVQYDRQTTTPAVWQIHSNGVLVKAGGFQPPTIGGGLGGGNVAGQQTLPATRWGTQRQTRDVRFGFRVTDAYSDYASAYWNDPGTVTGAVTGGRANHGSVIDGDLRTFLSGAYVHGPPGALGNYVSPGASPLIITTLSPGRNLGDLILHSTETFPDPSSTDRITAIIVTINNPIGTQEFQDLWWTGWRGTLAFFSDTEFLKPVASFPVGINRVAKNVIRIPLENLNISWAYCQGVILRISQHNMVGYDKKGATVGDVSVAIEYAPDVEGQRVGTIVDGSYFSTSATTTPSAIYDQVVSLGSMAKQLGREYGVDPWYLFSDVVGEGLRFSVILPTAGDGLRFAVADIFLELEYDPLSVVYDGQVLADVDGRVGVPVGGGAPVVLQNATDLLAYLVDGAEFYDLAGTRDAVSWPAARSMTEMAGWRMARAIVSETPLREIVADLVAESRQLLLADGLFLNARVRFEEATPAESVRLVGDQINPAYALVSDEVNIVNRMEEVFNSIGFYYRRNYVTGDFRAVLEELDAESVRLYRKRRATVDFQWHQSSRGYAGGLPEQQTRLKWLTGYAISIAARLWDYATFELPSSAVEDVQRYDVVTLNRPRSGYYATPGRVVSTQRAEGPIRWQVTMQMNRSTMGFAWQSADNPLTYIKLAEAGARMDFVVAGVLVAQLTSAGDFRARGAVSFPKVSVVSSAVDFGGGTAIHLYRVRGDGAFAGQFERLLTIGATGEVTVYAYNDGANVYVRNGAAPGIILNIGGVSGVVDTGTSTATGRAEFYLGNRLVMFIDSIGVTLLRRLSANLGTRIGSQ